MRWNLIIKVALAVSAGSLVGEMFVGTLSLRHATFMTVVAFISAAGFESIIALRKLS